MSTYAAGDLRIETNHAAGSLDFVWLGRSDAKDPTLVLQPLLESVKGSFDAMVVSFDFRSLEYMNSSTIHPLLNFLQTASSRSERVIVRYDSNKTWQRLSFRAVETLARSWGNITFEG